jgi:hypothetical protein
MAEDDFFVARVGDGFENHRTQTPVTSGSSTALLGEDP